MLYWSQNSQNNRQCTIPATDPSNAKSFQGTADTQILRVFLFHRIQDFILFFLNRHEAHCRATSHQGGRHSVGSSAAHCRKKPTQQLQKTAASSEVTSRKLVMRYWQLCLRWRADGRLAKWCERTAQQQRKMGVFHSRKSRPPLKNSQRDPVP